MGKTEVTDQGIKKRNIYIKSIKRIIEYNIKIESSAKNQIENFAFAKKVSIIIT